jgi:hypothetical protein
MSGRSEIIRNEIIRTGRNRNKCTRTHNNDDERLLLNDSKLKCTHTSESYFVSAFINRRRR